MDLAIKKWYGVRKMQIDTVKLYELDSKCKCFTARVLNCEKRGDLYAVQLDKTAFYPEGGGQPADMGMLGYAHIVDVQKEKGIIIHISDSPLVVAKEVTGVLDWSRRHGFMQEHSGEHIMSGIVHSLFGFDNVGFHIGSEFVTLDFNGELNEEQLTVVQTMANEAIYENIPIEINSYEKNLPQTYRSKKELFGEVRIVEVPGYDVCACCGTHVTATGEIGIIKILSSQRYKGGTRVTILCGRRALANYSQKNESVHEISALLSVKPSEVSGAAARVLDENKALKARTTALQEQVFRFRADAIDADYAIIFEAEYSPNELRRFCIQLCKSLRQAIVCSGNDEIGYKYALGSEKDDIRPLGIALNAQLHGRGGGPQELVQGALVATRAQIEAFFEARGFYSAQ